jgi:drug/metabolite transporter (DMT)-like permease
MAGLLRYAREHPWTYSCVLFIVIGAYTLTLHGKGHTLFWAGILLCAAGVLVAVVGYFLQRPKHDRPTR